MAVQDGTSQNWGAKLTTTQLLPSTGIRPLDRRNCREISRTPKKQGMHCIPCFT